MACFTPTDTPPPRAAGPRGAAYICPVRNTRSALTAATVVTTLAASLAACTASPDPTPTATPEPTATAVTADPTATAGPTSEPTETAAPQPSASATGEPSADATLPADPGITTGSAANDYGTTDAERVFEQTYGSLSEADGVEVDHSVGTTDAGAPLLIVEVAPIEGNGGDIVLTYFALFDDAVVQGVLSSPDEIDDDERAAFEAHARAAVHP